MTDIKMKDKKCVSFLFLLSATDDDASALQSPCSATRRPSEADVSLCLELNNATKS